MLVTRKGPNTKFHQMIKSKTKVRGTPETLTERNQGPDFHMRQSRNSRPRAHTVRTAEGVSWPTRHQHKLVSDSSSLFPKPFGLSYSSCPFSRVQMPQGRVLFPPVARLGPPSPEVFCVTSFCSQGIASGGQAVLAFGTSSDVRLPSILLFLWNKLILQGSRAFSSPRAQENKRSGRIRGTSFLLQQHGTALQLKQLNYLFLTKVLS